MPHNASMEEEQHLFTVEIVIDPLNADRFRWNVCQGSQITMRSPHSYATRRQAQIDGEEALRRIEGRLPQR
jgi:hypothetical protein